MTFGNTGPGRHLSQQHTAAMRQHPARHRRIECAPARVRHQRIVPMEVEALACHSRVHARSCVKLLANSRCAARSEEHTSELQSLMRISYAVFCLKKKKQKT